MTIVMLNVFIFHKFSFLYASLARLPHSELLDWQHITPGIKSSINTVLWSAYGVWSNIINHREQSNATLPLTTASRHYSWPHTPGQSAWPPSTNKHGLQTILTWNIYFQWGNCWSLTSPWRCSVHMTGQGGASSSSYQPLSHKLSSIWKLLHTLHQSFHLNFMSCWIQTDFHTDPPQRTEQIEVNQEVLLFWFHSQPVITRLSVSYVVECGLLYCTGLHCFSAFYGQRTKRTEWVCSLS